MNASGKGLVAFWLHRKGDHWSVKSVDKQSSPQVQERDCEMIRTEATFIVIVQNWFQLTQAMQKSSLYHYMTPAGKYKTAVIFQLDKEIGPELSKVLLLFHVSYTIDLYLNETKPRLF